MSEPKSPAHNSDSPDPKPVGRASRNKTDAELDILSDEQRKPWRYHLRYHFRNSSTMRRVWFTSPEDRAAFINVMSPFVLFSGTGEVQR